MPDSRVAILVPGRISPRVTERLSERFELIAVPHGTELALSPQEAERVRGVAVSGQLTADWIAKLPHLEMIASFGVGYDGVDVHAAAARGIVVSNTPDVLNDEVADTTIALLLNTVRQLPQAETWLRQGRWASEGPFPLSPLSLKGRHVGIHGLGRIGLEIARRLEPFKVRISYCTRRPRTDVSYAHFPTLLGLAEVVDVLISIVPKTPETIGAIDADVLRALGPRGVLINVGRGTTVDEPALIAALKNGTIAAAGLDVFTNEPQVPKELIDLPNVSLLPHVASASVPTRNAMADLVVDNLISWFETGRALTPVPETPQKA
ncbi:MULTISPECIES: 2-hydroxyacid dehydrogenase [Alphaproteobacteria]|uniref:Dehydrogenase n=2 Tax=Alphaproteobacteria TaxID=28211 RepID=A0A512HIX2_9HYPH|nr:MULTISPECIES: 2-hydroxyacid dehydrogenase [Alphaproteobacteria]GEO85409.1 dehydrogenase [Ciceribacter naphthalenivorans]GLR21569.1 dehydrogenase [Ciceribacter naphthalenivorans]GLT04425.1 dehydrogenase [Sphingomonas psychrolutea]